MMSFPRPNTIFHFLSPSLESLDRGLFVVKFNIVMAAGTSQGNLCWVSWFTFIPNCSPHMWQMTPDATKERNPALEDLLAPEKELALFIEAFFY